MYTIWFILLNSFQALQNGSKNDHYLEKEMANLIAIRSELFTELFCALFILD